jgi:ubiquinone/menaquinone biosynthesis C-methylase UbiE
MPDPSVRERVSAIAHGDLAFHDPLDPATIDAILDLAGLQPGARVLDIGCGPGELVIRIAERYGCAGVGIDAAPNQIMAAIERASRRARDVDLRFEIGDASAAELEPESFDFTACLGSAHALGGTEPALRTMYDVTRPGGHVLYADGFWEREPPPEYLEALGATRDELGTFGDLLNAAQDAGLTPIYCHVTTGQEWDRYEWTLILNAQRALDADPAGELSEALGDRVRAARSRLAAPGGRGTLGFAALLLSRAAR